MLKPSAGTKLSSSSWYQLCLYLLIVVNLVGVDGDINCGGLVSHEPSQISGCGPITVVWIPSDGSGRYNMVLNASMPIYSNENIEVQLENEDEVKRGTASRLKYIVTHPECDKQILVTNLLFNNRVLCQNAPHHLSPRQPVTRLYHQSTHYGQRSTNLGTNSITAAGNTVHIQGVNDGNVGNFAVGIGNGAVGNNIIGSTQPARPTLPFQTSQQVNSWQDLFGGANFFNGNPFLENAQFGLPANSGTNFGIAGINPNVNNRVPQPIPDDSDLNSVCGHFSVALIQGGTNAQPGEFPWLGGLFIRSRNTYLCTVNLVSQRHAITAAHCFTNPESAEIYGILWGHPSSGVDKYYMRLRTIRIHPAYNSTRLLHDVAIVFLADTVTFSVTLKPICMWQSGREGGLMGVNGMVAGFGPDYTELKKIDFPIVSQETCRASNVIFHFQTSEFTFCAGRRKSDEGPCKGDSGAGYMQWIENRFFLRGLVSSSINANGNCNLKEYIIFADLSKEIQWLQRAIT